MFLPQLPGEVTDAVDFNTLIEGAVAQPIINLLQPYLTGLSYLAGIIALLYIILLLYRIYAERRKIKLLEAIHYDFDHLNKHYGISHSAERKGFFKRLFSKKEETNSKQKR